MADFDLPNAQDFLEIETERLKDFGDYALGLRLLVKCSQATYVGICHHILHNSREIILEQVSVANSGVRNFGLVVIFFHDVMTLFIIGVDRNARERLCNELYKDDKRRHASLMKQILPPSFCDEVEEGQAVSNDSANETADGTSTLLSNFHCALVRPAEWKVIDSLEEHFEHALHKIKQENVISIFASGLKLGRRGTLVWLCIEAGGFVYLFDVAKLGVDALLKSGIGAILCAETMVKIVHDGRKFEDYLYHCCHMNMMNVFDTQASDIYLDSLNEEKKLPILVKSLVYLLQEHLELPKASVVKLFPEIEDEDYLWLERPLPEGLIVSLVHSVIFLRELREKMLKRILLNLEQVNRVFLGSLRDQPSALVDWVEEKIVPPDVQKMLKQPSFSKSFKISYIKQQN